ncbi:Mu transposase domain-containing protein [Actinocorallia longicatena]|uniref:Mu transposase domain-containing protein n=1 Tax=Actinocorallia longicatena TaxID=111803 RepID=UPI003CD0A58D
MRGDGSARHIGRQLRVMLHASRLIVYYGKKVVAEHERLFAKDGRRWSWTTTWRSWSASPARCRARPPWSRPAPRASPRRSTTPGGRRPARPTATATALARSSRCCCRPAICPPNTWSPAWPPP